MSNYENEVIIIEDTPPSSPSDTPASVIPFGKNIRPDVIALQAFEVVPNGLIKNYNLNDEFILPNEFPRTNNIVQQPVTIPSAERRNCGEAPKNVTQEPLALKKKPSLSRSASTSKRTVKKKVSIYNKEKAKKSILTESNLNTMNLDIVTEKAPQGKNDDVIFVKEFKYCEPLETSTMTLSRNIKRKILPPVHSKGTLALSLAQPDEAPAETVVHTGQMPAPFKSAAEFVPVNITATVLTTNNLPGTNQTLIPKRAPNRKGAGRKKYKNSKKLRPRKYGTDQVQSDDSTDENFRPKKIPKLKWEEQDEDDSQYVATRRLTRSQFRNWPVSGLNEQPFYKPATGIIHPFGTRLRPSTLQFIVNNRNKSLINQVCHEILHLIFGYVKAKKAIDKEEEDKRKEEEEKEMFMRYFSLLRVDSRDMHVCNVVKESLKKVKRNIRLPNTELELDELVINSFYLYCITNNIYQSAAYAYIASLDQEDIVQVTNTMLGLVPSHQQAML